MFNLRSVDKVRSQTPCSPPVTYIQYDMAIHDLDIEIANVSIGLSQDLMVDRLIGNIRIFMTKKCYVRIANESHHLVTPELMARKWVIALEKTEYTLKAPTQYCIFSYLLPLTRRNRTYLISQCLRSISCTFYTDTLFVKQKYIIGNTCAQIFMDGE